MRHISWCEGPRPGLHSFTRWFASHHMCFAGYTSGEEPTCQCRRHKRCRFDPWVLKIPRRRAWQPTAVFLPGESHGQRSLAGYRPQGHKRIRHDLATEQQQLQHGNPLHHILNPFSFSLLECLLCGGSCPNQLSLSIL